MTASGQPMVCLIGVAVHVLALASGAAAGSWTRAHVNALPDEAFAAVHVRPDGTRSRHLPHHDADGRLDLPHLRSALARLDQVHWEDPADAERAWQHLLAHEKALGFRRGSSRPPGDGPRLDRSARRFLQSGRERRASRVHVP